jgi:hypothetical protein
MLKNTFSTTKIGKYILIHRWQGSYGSGSIMETGIPVLPKICMNNVNSTSDYTKLSNFTSRFSTLINSL